MPFVTSPSPNGSLPDHRSHDRTSGLNPSTSDPTQRASGLGRPSPLGPCRILAHKHLAILNDLVCEVLPNVDVLGSLTAADDVVTPFNTRRVVLVYRGRLPLPESKSAQKVSEVQDLTARSRCRVVLAVVFCIFDFHMIGDLLYSMTMPDVDLREELLPQSAAASAYPDNRSTSFIPMLYLILKLGCAARYSMRWCRAAH